MAILPVHQMIQTPDILGNFRQGIAFGQQQQERQEKRADQQQLRKLAGSVQQGDPAAYSQAAAIDPEAAGKQLGAGDAMARRAEGLIKMMEQADATSPQQAQALWQSYGVPFARQFSQGSEPTTDWAQAKPMLASLKARIEMAKSAQAGNVQSTQILANGNIGLVTRTGQVIDTGQAASPSTQVINEPGQTPYLVTTGRGAIGQTTAIGPSGQAGVPATAQPAGAPQVTQADMEADIVLANEMIAAGIPEAQVNAFLTQRGQRASAQQPAPMAAASGAPVAQRNPTAAEVEAQKTAAREQAELGFLPQRGSLEAENAARRVAAEEQARIGLLPQRNIIEAEGAGQTEEAKRLAESRAEAIQNLPRVTQESTNAIRLIDQALAHPGRAAATGMTGTYDPRNYLPGTDARDFQRLLEQIQGGTFLQAFQSLKGGGAITQVEGSKAEQAIARLNRDQSDEAFEQSLRELRSIAASAIARAQARVNAGGAPQQSRQATPGRIRYDAQGNRLP